MGFSISASTALIFAALFLAFGTLYPAMANGYERVEDADAAAADQNLRQAETDIRLNTVTPSGGGGGNINNFTVNITNTGETTLTVNETNIIVDGEYISWSNGDTTDAVTAEVETDSQTNLWLPNESVDIVYDEGGTFSKPNRFKIITEHGVSVSGDV